MKLNPITIALLTAIALPVMAEEASETSIERITVQGEFRSRGIEDVAASVSVLNGDDLRQRQAEHLEAALLMAPNVNLASGASRASFVQIRGIGERSQFVDPINPSVGLMLDGINYSGLGSVGILFDIGQVEVFRGPQSTRFGADAMAGMIYMSSTALDADPNGVLEAMLANYNSRSLGFAYGSAVNQDLVWRGSLFGYQSDGFIDNIHLGRKDTQNQDEITLRLNAHWQLSDQWSADFTYHHFNLDNGYDAWSLDRNRQTLSDTPGKDTLDSHAGRIAVRYLSEQGYELQLMTSYLTADSEYSFDEDWAFEGIRPGWEYNSWDAYYRERDQVELEARLLSAQPLMAGNVATDWLVGIYRQERTQDLDRDYTYLSAPFSSQYDTERTAVYGELQQQLSERLRLTYGVRWERYDNDYRDSRGITATPTDDAWGGRVSIEYQLASMQTVYSSLTRGFKGGGVNGEALGRVEDRNLEDHREFLQSRATFDSEYLTNLEVGYKAFLPEQSVSLQLNAFYSWRDDMQVNAYVERNAVFVTYMDNASDGTNYGIEAQLDWVANDALRLFVNLGWLETEFNDLVLRDGTNLRGRAQAHAPNWQIHLGGEYSLPQNWLLRLELDGRDKFYYSNSHDQQSSSYGLVHARLSKTYNQWEFSLWARNLLDKDYTTRGFYFGNDPRKDYVAENYIQFGEPRRFGVTARYRF